MQRELDRIRTLASRLRQEGDKLDKWLANMDKMLAVQQEKVRRSKRFEEEKNKRRTDKLLRQIQDLKRLAGVPEQIVRYSRTDLENM
jgi:DNA polymerase III psi subunit